MITECPPPWMASTDMEEHSVNRKVNAGILLLALRPPETVFPSNEILSRPMKLFSECNKKYHNRRLQMWLDLDAPEYTI